MMCFTPLSLNHGKKLNTGISNLVNLSHECKILIVSMCYTSVGTICITKK